MSLTIEWTRRIDLWRNALKENFYRPLGTLALEGFVTPRQLAPVEALTGTFQPCPAGTAWGAKWEYGWFRTTVVVPAAAKGQRLELKLDVGAESRVMVNGKAAGARDQQHQTITLARRARPGDSFDILVEGYAGHGPMVCGAGPVTPPGRLSVPEPGPTQVHIGESTFGIWQEDVYQLWIDVETLAELRNALDQNLLRVAQIDEALMEFTTLADLEAPLPELLAGVRNARARLQPLLACVNGSTAPTLYAYGHSHIDVAWLWPLQETERKCARTFGTQLALMAEYPEYKFLQSQAHLFWMTKRLYPELYARIRKAVKDGQFLPEGGMWVEADTNISGGESLIRQFIHGKRFFRDEFDVECEMLWLPDVFGYSGNMPQIMRGCGIRYFSTAKIFWNYNGGDPFPFNTFTWEGIDGSTVLAHFCNDYNSQTRPSHVMARWNERVQKNGISARLMPFGWGDGGGGPTRDHLEFLRRQTNLEGLPQVRIASPIDFFKDLEKSGIPDARYVGELYYQCHRGTYTSQARTKRGNRKSELALREAECWAAIASVRSGYQVPAERLAEAWRHVLLNQFHDIIPGSSIHRVYEEAEAGYAHVLDTAETVAAEALAGFTDESLQHLTVFNSLSWDRSALVPLPEGARGAATDGTPLPTQDIAGETLAEIALPACGWATVELTKTPAKTPRGLKVTAKLLENECLRLTLNERGELTGIWDKQANRELAAGPCNSFHMYKDVPGWFDAWDIDSMYALTPVALDAPAKVEVIAAGPLIGTLRVTRRLGESAMVQEISLRRGAHTVEFFTTVDWQESHRLLKVNFPVNIHANEAIHEIQFGHIRRPTHRSRPFDADRFEVAQQKWTALAEEGRGCALLNDCKYGVNVLGNSMNLTLLRSPLAPDMTADKGHQEFSYAFHAWNGSFAESAVVREAYELNCPVASVSGAAGTQSLLRVDAANVIIDTIKPAEDGSGDVVVRLFECKHTATACTLTTSLPARAAALVTMLETEPQALPLKQGSMALEFRPFEIKTVRLELGM